MMSTKIWSKSPPYLLHYILSHYLHVGHLLVLFSSPMTIIFLLIALQYIFLLTLFQTLRHELLGTEVVLTVILHS